MTNKSTYSVHRCVSKNKYSVSLIISLTTAVILSITNLSYTHISVIAIFMFGISLVYLYSYRLIEGAESAEDKQSRELKEAQEYSSQEVSGNTPATADSSAKIDKIIDGIDSVVKDAGFPADSIKSALTPEFITEIKGIVSSIIDPVTDANLDKLAPGANGIPHIDTTPKTQNIKVAQTINAVRDTNSTEKCNYSQETECVAADSCIWVIRKSDIKGTTTLCERGDISGPYPSRNVDGSLIDVDRDYYKLK